MASNAQRGSDFETVAGSALGNWLGVTFEVTSIDIGQPPKSHKFDLVSADRKYVGEAKAFSWTISGNVPSAKITTLREAAMYLNWLPSTARTFIVMKRALRGQRDESLAEYFARLNDSLLGSVAVIELDPVDARLRVVRQGRMPRIES